MMTVGELIEVLRKLPPDMQLMNNEGTVQYFPTESLSDLSWYIDDNCLLMGYSADASENIDHIVQYIVSH